MKKIIVVATGGMLGHNNKYAAVFDDQEIDERDLRQLLCLATYDDYDIFQYQELELIRELVEQKRIQFNVD